MLRTVKIDIKLEKLVFTKDGDNLVISSKKLKEPTIVENFFTENNRVDYIKTPDMSNKVLLKDVIQLNINSVQNENGIYTAVGTKYNDIIKGSQNDDTITGSKGNDIIYGYEGKDVFVFNEGDGTDTIKDATSKDELHLECDITKLTYTRVKNDLEIGYGTDDKIILSNFFKNKSTDNIYFIDNMDSETRARYEYAISDPNPHVAYAFWNDKYELCEKSILSDAIINIGEKNKYTGTDYNEYVNVTGKNGKFNLGTGKDTLFYSGNFGKSSVTLNKYETLNLAFNSENNYSFKLKGKDLVISVNENDKGTITLKNYVSKYTDSTVKINGSYITSIQEYKDMLNFTSDDFSKKGKFTGTDLGDTINASDFTTTKKIKNVTINSGSGNDIITGSEKYNDIIVSNSKAGESTNIREFYGTNKITTGKGNDYIDVRLNSSNTINAGDGSNTIYLASEGTNKVTTGDGYDVVTILDGFNNINLGAGRNSVNISGGTNTIVTGKDADIFSTHSGSSSIKSGDGDDEFKIYNGTAVLDGEAGDDTYDFTHFYDTKTNLLNSHVDIVDSEGSNTMIFSDKMVTMGATKVFENNMILQEARMDGRANIFFDVSINNDGSISTGDDLLFTTDNKFVGFDGTGVHVVGKDSISTIITGHEELLCYEPVLYTYEPTEYRPVYGLYSSGTYSLSLDEVAQKVAGWLADTEQNVDGYKSAMEVFNNGTDKQILELTAIYTDNATSCYKSVPENIVRIY